MNIAIIGYGKMGKEIARIAEKRGHKISLVIDVNNADSLTAEYLGEVDVAIEFSSPAAAKNNITACLKCNTPIVSGTTGWLESWDEVTETCRRLNGSLFYASNYSIGVNIIFALNTKLATIMDAFPQYEVHIEETHHVQKLDAPSGTAISLANQIIENTARKGNWSLEPGNTDTIFIKASREGEVKGYHKVIYESDLDVITISHDAKSREGFATGAVMAAEFILDKQGVFGMGDMLKL